MEEIEGQGEGVSLLSGELALLCFHLKVLQTRSVFLRVYPFPPYARATQRCRRMFQQVNYNRI